MKTVIKKYIFLIAVFMINILVLAIRPETGVAALCFTGQNFLNFVVILAPIFILIGLMDVWIERELMIRMMGKQSGLRGTMIAFLLGTITAVPLYALLPVAWVLLRKGSRIYNVLIFLCSSASVRVPLLLFEISSLGWKFTLIRFAANIVVVFLIAFIVERSLSVKDTERIYERASKME